MTKTADNTALDAAKAAALVKSTAESTATALNIQYIQKDILEIKEGVKQLTTTQNGKVEELENKIDVLSRIVYTGVGISIAISALLKFLK